MKSTALRLAILTLASASLFPRSSDSTIPSSDRMSTMPRTTLWAWERRTDLSGLDPQTTAVAFLDQTIHLSDLGATSSPRRQPLLIPASEPTIAVVRIEAPDHPNFTPSLREQTIRLLLHSANRSGIAALQLDFDAARSQQTFYRSLILELRRQMPASVPLSITALVSWCSSDDWLRGLPIDEAVPMYFRMGPDRRNFHALSEPLCQHSLGLSTTEHWPETAGKRLYVFSDRGWQNEPQPLLVDVAMKKAIP